MYNAKQDYLLNNEPVVFDKNAMTKREWKTVCKMFRLPNDIDIRRITIPVNRMACTVVIENEDKMKFSIADDMTVIHECKEQGLIPNDEEVVENQDINMVSEPATDTTSDLVEAPVESNVIHETFSQKGE